LSPLSSCYLGARTLFCYLLGLLSSPTRRSSDLRRPVPCLLRPEPDGVGRQLAAVLAEPLCVGPVGRFFQQPHLPVGGLDAADLADRKSTRLNSSHVSISYAVFSLQKKKP